MSRLYQLIEKLIPKDFFESVKEIYKLTREWVELKIKYGERQLSSTELRRLWDVDVTGKDYALNYGLCSVIGYCGYGIRHPIRSLEATIYHLIN